MAAKKVLKTVKAEVKTLKVKEATATKGIKKVTIQKIKRPTRIKAAVPKDLLQIRHDDSLNPKMAKHVPFQLSKIRPEILKRGGSSPKVALALEPKEGNALVYHPTPGFTSQDPQLAQFSVRATIYNTGSETLDLDKVIIEYKKGSQVSEKKIFLPSDKLTIEPGFEEKWQNNRDYHENGDIVFLEAPFPDKVTMEFHFKGFTNPVSATKNLKPYSHSFRLPFKPENFETDEYLSSYSMHGGGSQVFAYDIGASAYKDKKWSGLHPNKDGSENAHYRIYGKKVYAMDDGVVLHFENNVPNNWKPEGSEAGKKKQKDELWGSFDYGNGGNHFMIRHGNLVASYCHFQKGSLNDDFMEIGKQVKAGDFLGKCGNSGNSTGPHLHLDLKTYTSDDKPQGGVFRPLLFNNGFAIGQAEYAVPYSNVNWSSLDTLGIPGLKSKASYVHPSDVHPYCAYPTNWGEVCRFGVKESDYQKVFDKIWTCGYYPIWVDGYDVGGTTFFNVIFRQSKNVQWVARHGMDGTGFQKEFDIWEKAKYRLINVNSYLSNGKTRYAGVWVKDNKTAWFAYHGKTLAWHESKFEEHWKKGYVPTNVSSVHTGGKTYVTALWEKKNTGGFYLRPQMDLQDFKDAFKQYTDKEKFKLVYLDAYEKNGKPMLNGIWYKNAPNYNSWYEKHHLSASQFQTEYDSMLDNGYLTRCIAGYSSGGKARFEGIWSK